MSAEDRGPAADSPVLQAGAAVSAGLTLAAIDIQLLPEVAGPAVAAYKIPQGGAAGVQSLAQHLFNGLRQGSEAA